MQDRETVNFGVFDYDVLKHLVSVSLLKPRTKQNHLARVWKENFAWIPVEFISNIHLLNKHKTETERINTRNLKRQCEIKIYVIANVEIRECHHLLK